MSKSTRDADPLLEPIFLCLLLSVVSHGARAEQWGRAIGRSIIKNGDFAKGLENWAAPKDVFSLNRKEGSRAAPCLQLANTRPSIYRLATQAVSLRPGATYRLSAWIRTEKVKPGLNRGGATACLEWGSAKRWIGGIWHNGYTGTNGWQRLDLVGTIPAGADRGWVHLYLCKGATGRSWFDDVALHEIVPKPLVVVLLRPCYRGIIWPGEDRLPLLLRLFVGESLFTNRSDKPRLLVKLNRRLVVTRSIPGPGKYTIEIDSSELTPGHWKAEVQLTMPGKTEPEEVETVTGEVWPRGKPRPRVWVNNRGKLIVAGKPFYPLGIYLGGVGKKELDALKGSPFNTVLPYAVLGPARYARDPQAAIKNLMGDMERRGLKIIFSLLDTFSRTKGYIKKGLGRARGENAMLSLVVGAAKDSPALLAYYLNDEYPLELAPYFADRYQRVRRLDPGHPAWICHWRIPELKYHAGTTDIMGVDPYPIGPKALGKKASLKQVSDWTRSAIDVYGGYGSAWVVIQAHNVGLYRDAATLKQSRAPTREEMLCMSFLAIAEGANGLMYYSLFDLMRDPLGFEKRWADICAVVRQVRLVVPALLSDMDPLVVKLTGSVGQNIKFRCVAETKASALLIAVNPEPRPGKLSLKLPSIPRKIEPVIGKWSPAPSVSPEITLQPFAVVVSRIHL